MSVFNNDAKMQWAGGGKTGVQIINTSDLLHSIVNIN